MNLDDAQKKTVSSWIAQGLKLSDIQKKMASDLGLTVTYMEVRFLVDDLKLTPKDIEPPKNADLSRATANSSAQPASPAAAKGPGLGQEAAKPAGGVSVTVDEIARPGTVASGNVTFSDGNSAEWYLDQTGRLGLMPRIQGYRPPQADVAAFQAELQNVLARMGL